jgi:hypothetical protein
MECNIGGKEYCHVADYLFGYEHPPVRLYRT